MTKDKCLAHLNLLGINCTDNYNIVDKDLSNDIFVLNQTEDYGAGYLSYKNHQGNLESTMFLKYQDMITRALMIARDRRRG